MDHLFRVKQRLALLDPDGKQVQKELARALIRSGRMTEAYKLYRQSGLLGEQDPEAMTLLAEMTDEQQAALKNCPDRWLGDSSFPDYPTARSPALYRIIETRAFIDALSIKAEISDAILQQVAAIPHLLCLRLTDRRFRADLGALAGTSIEYLKLAKVNPKRSPLNSLESLTQLRGLKIHCQRLNPHLAGSISRLNALEDLELTVNQKSLNALRQIQNKKLQTLSVKGDRLGDEELLILGDCPKLTEVQIGAGEFTQVGLDALCQLPQLERLSLAFHRSLGKLDLSGLSKLSGLESIELRQCRFQESQAAVLASLPKLKALSLIECPRMGNGVLEFLKDLKHIESLDLNGCQITDSGVAKLAHLSSLKVLFLGGSQVTTAGLRPLAQIPDLEILLWDHHVYFRDSGPPLLEYLDGLSDAS